MIALFLLCWVAGALSQEQDPNFDCPDPTGLFTDPTSCEHYYNCGSGVAWRYPCPDGTLWDQNIQNVSFLSYYIISLNRMLYPKN